MYPIPQLQAGRACIPTKTRVLYIKKIQTSRLVLQFKEVPRRHVCWFLSLEFKGKGFYLFLFFFSIPSEELGRGQYSCSHESLQMYGLCQHSCFPVSIDKDKTKDVFSHENAVGKFSLCHLYGFISKSMMKSQCISAWFDINGQPNQK